MRFTAGDNKISNNGEKALPAFVVSGTHSGCGKTTIALGLMMALKKKGFAVQGFKVGPDFIDAGIHSIVTGRPSRNLDVWMCGEEFVCETFLAGAGAADISIIEGVMGMFDGDNNTARLAKLIDAPVVLIVDAYGAAESAGAVVRGFVETGSEHFGVRFAGVILNRIASESHYQRIAKSVSNIPVLGYLPREAGYEISHRHLGLLTAEEEPLTKYQLERLSDTITNHVDLDSLIKEAHYTDNKAVSITLGRGAESACDKSICCNTENDNDDTSNVTDLAGEAGALRHTLNSMCQQTQATQQITNAEGQGVRVEQQIPNIESQDARAAQQTGHRIKKRRIKLAVALDKAFCFYYEDNFELLRENGAEIIPFSPLSDAGLPRDADGVYIGGGYPEIYALELSNNNRMLRSVKDWSEEGKPLYAECGGLMYLSNAIKDLAGDEHKMSGVFSFKTSMKQKPVLGYREVELHEDCILGRKSQICRGHEFHYSELDAAELDCELSRQKTIYTVRDNKGCNKKGSRSFLVNNTLASYIHIHFGSDTQIARNIVDNIAGIVEVPGQSSSVR